MLTKYDFLVTEAQDKIVQTIQFLQEDDEIEKDLSLREIYNKYLHPNVLPIETDKKIWEALGKMSVINTFQFEGAEGVKTAKLLKPQSILEMADANGSNIGPYIFFRFINGVLPAAASKANGEV